MIEIFRSYDSEYLTDSGIVAEGGIAFAKQTTGSVDTLWTQDLRMRIRAAVRNSRN
jgi:hypothetical protein